MLQNGDHVNCKGANLGLGNSKSPRSTLRKTNTEPEKGTCNLQVPFSGSAARGQQSIECAFSGSMLAFRSVLASSLSSRTARSSFQGIFATGSLHMQLSHSLRRRRKGEGEELMVSIRHDHTCTAITTTIPWSSVYNVMQGSLYIMKSSTTKPEDLLDTAHTVLAGTCSLAPLQVLSKASPESITASVPSQTALPQLAKLGYVSH